MAQSGFFFDQSRCIGCNSCAVACLQWKGLPPGAVKPQRVYQWERGAFPQQRVHRLALGCYHCTQAVCISVCAQGALYREEKYGAVLVNADLCTGCRKCFTACPYGAPQFADDEAGTKMQKCDLCQDRLEQQQLPICVRSCSMRALEFGEIGALRAKYGDSQQLQEMPAPRTNPNVVFKPMEAKRQILTWNAERALELWQIRSPQAADDLIFRDAAAILQDDGSNVGRNHLDLKAKTVKQKNYATTDDE